jgi:hypothetical protein
VHAGAFITPSASAVPADQTYVTATFLILTAPITATATAFAWHSRAPPRR